MPEKFEYSLRDLKISVDKVQKAPSVDPRRASKHFDIVLGLDFHFVIVNTFIPIPFPLVPFGGFVFDIMDYIHITIPAFPVFQDVEAGEGAFGSDLKISMEPMPLGGTVMIDGFHKTTATSGLFTLPPTIPPLPGLKSISALKIFSPLHFIVPKFPNPIMYILLKPFAPHDGQISHGSETVFTESKEQSVHMNDVWTCNELGEIVPTVLFPLFHHYASRIVFTLPFGKPVIIGGPYRKHVFTRAEILNALLMMGLMLLVKKILGKVLTAINQAIKNKNLDNPKIRGACDVLQSYICELIGEPVDVASGYLTGSIQGFDLDGPLPFVWKAKYFTDTKYKGALGMGMYHSYSHSLMVLEKEKSVALCDNEGVITPFPTLERGESFFNAETKWTLFRNDKGDYFAGNKQGLFYYFTPDENKDGWRQLRLVCDRNGFSLKFNYRNDLLIDAVDSVGRKIFFRNDPNGQIIEILAPSADDPNVMQTMMQYSYDNKGRMVSFVDATQVEQILTWHEDNDKMASRKFKGGYRFTFSYDKENRCIAAESSQGMFSYYFEYHDGYTIATDSMGVKKRYYHRNGIVTKEVNSRGGEKIYHYDNDRNLRSITAPDSTTRIYNYDERGNITEMQIPGKGVVKATYNDKDQPLSITQPNGGVWLYEYDDSGNLIKRTNPEERMVEFDWDSGLLKEIKDSQSGNTRLHYNSQASLSSVTYPDNSTDEWQKDYHNNTLKYTNVKNAETRYKYDKSGRLLEKYLPDGNLIKYSYDLSGNLNQIKDRDAQVYARYNLFGDIVERRDAKGTLLFSYDKEGRLIAVTNENGEKYRLRRDSEGDLKEEVGFDGISRRYERDYTGLVKRVIQNEKYETVYEYDNFSRIDRIIRSDKSEEFFDYDIAGNLCRIQNKDADVCFERDIMGRIIKERCNGHEINSRYNALGRRTQLTSSLGADIEAAYNPWGDLENLSTEGWASGYKHDRMGLETERVLPGNIRRETQRDGLGRVTGQEIFKNNTQLDEKAYLWGTNDRLTAMIHNGKEQHYEYDSRGFLTQTQYADGSSEIRVPDDTGNLYETLNKDDRKYGKGGQLIKTDRWEYKYDDRGNLVRKKGKDGQVWRYEWDAVGMLSRVKRPDAHEVTFKYDALGRRIEKRFNRTVTRWVWDGNTPLHEWREIHTSDYETDRGHITTIDKLPVTTWVFEVGTFVPVAKIEQLRKQSIIANYMGTPEAMYDERGNKTWGCELNSYGRVRNFEGKTKTDCPFRYQGQYEDAETGLYYNRFRYYSPSEGMYVSQDPIRLKGNNPTFYGYVKDTNNWLDIFGLDSSALDANLGGSVGDGLQAHHIIPEQVWGNHQQMFDTLGMNMDASQNGIHLADSEAGRIANGDGVYHRGSHPQYNAQLEADVAAIESRWQPGVNDAQIRTELETLQNKTRTDIENGDVPQSEKAVGCKLG